MKKRAPRRSPAKKRATRRSPRVVAVVSNPRRRSVRRRRRNPSVGPLASLALAAGAGAVALYVATLAAQHDVIPASVQKSPMGHAALLGAVAIGGGFALFKFAPPAAYGVAAGLGGFALYSAGQSAKQAAEKPAPATETTDQAKLAAVYDLEAHRLGAGQLGAVYDMSDVGAVRARAFT